MSLKLTMSPFNEADKVANSMFPSQRSGEEIVDLADPERWECPPDHRLRSPTSEEVI